MLNDGNNTIGSNELIARMAAAIAGGIEANPDITGLSAEDVAERAVAVAESIVARVSRPVQQ